MMMMMMMMQSSIYSSAGKESEHEVQAHLHESSESKVGLSVLPGSMPHLPHDCACINKLEVVLQQAHVRCGLGTCPLQPCLIMLRHGSAIQHAAMS